MRLISCRSCEEPDCAGCNMYTLMGMLASMRPGSVAAVAMNKDHSLSVNIYTESELMQK